MGTVSVDNRLHWTPRADGGPVAELHGAGVIVDLPPGSSRVLVIDHRDEARFGLAEAPAFEVPAGVRVVLLAGPAVIDGEVLGPGDGFAVEIFNDAVEAPLLYGGSYGGSYSYGDADVADVAYAFARRGVLL